VEWGEHFDAGRCGMIRGRVRWDGDVPETPPLEVKSLIFAADGAREKWHMPNPNAPRVDGREGVANAVVFLRGIDRRRAKPWPYPAVRIVQQDRSFRIHHGETPSPYGFVRRGDFVEMTSRDPYIHVLHADGAAYFSLAFPDPGIVLRRSLHTPGLVELSSGAGYFHMRGYLFVQDHPYVTCTDGTGAFELDKVPAGRYEVVAWMPNWREARREREPETGVVTRLFFRPACQHLQEIEVTPGRTVETTFCFSPSDFDE
jgi:hypothetical protein